MSLTRGSKGVTRHTYKQELIKSITMMFKRSTLTPLPPSCLHDMSTSSLAAFREWLTPLIEEKPVLIGPEYRLPPPKKR